MRFYILTRQPGEGCDYTIGCGMRWALIEAGTVEEAAIMAAQKVRDRGWRGEGADKAILVPADSAVDLAPLLDADVAREAAERDFAERQKTEASERAEYERLHKKYG